MEKIILRPTSTAEWQALVLEAESKCGQHFQEDIESYLVFLLQRFLKRPEVVSGVVAMDYLGASDLVGNERLDRLQDVGDKCLLLAGLFPEHAKRRRVPVSYFIQIGQSAYGTLSDLQSEALAELYVALQDEFVPLKTTLNCMRNMKHDIIPN